MVRICFCIYSFIFFLRMRWENITNGMKWEKLTYGWSSSCMINGACARVCACACALCRSLPGHTLSVPARNTTFCGNQCYTKYTVIQWNGKGGRWMDELLYLLIIDIQESVCTRVGRTSPNRFDARYHTKWQRTKRNGKGWVALRCVALG